MTTKTKKKQAKKKKTTKKKASAKTETKTEQNTGDDQPLLRRAMRHSHGIKEENTKAIFRELIDELRLLRTQLRTPSVSAEILNADRDLRELLLEAATYDRLFDSTLDFRGSDDLLDKWQVKHREAYKAAKAKTQDFINLLCSARLVKATLLQENDGEDYAFVSLECEAALYDDNEGKIDLIARRSCGYSTKPAPTMPWEKGKAKKKAGK